MKLGLLDLLACPNCGGTIQLTKKREIEGEVESGFLNCMGCMQQFPIVQFVPRFVQGENYATTFGLQWSRFRQTQLDSHSGLPISRDRFFRQTGWTSRDLTGKTVLDVGCGAGRFAEIVLSCRANLVALDFSSAVDACWQNLGLNPHFNVVQGDIYSLPFKPAQFDFVYCFGVLQHTPNVKRAFLALPIQLHGGGRLAVDIYLDSLKGHLMHPRYWLRPITTHMSPQSLFPLIECCTPFLLAVSKNLERVPIIGRYLKRLIPVANYETIYPLSKTQLLEWAILDTYDWLSPRYDQPQTAATLQGWFEETGLENIEVLRIGHLVGRGFRPTPIKTKYASRH